MKKFSPPILQVALDFIKISDAIRIAEATINNGVDWLECGTPLIKSEGVRAIKVLREKFPDATIVADMKTVDTGKLEADLAFSAGANIVSVLAIADNKTIVDALDVARSYGGLLMVDLLGHPNPDTRAKELATIGVDIILYHIGIDQQLHLIFPVDIVKILRDATDKYLAVAGGINDKLAYDVVRLGADIVIVGRFITKAENPAINAKSVKEAMIKGYQKRST